MKLIEKDEGLTLLGEDMELCADFSYMLPRLRRDRLSQELLVKAARVRGVENPLCVDATAGLGEDAMLLAASGFSVVLCEKNETIVALLADALRRAARNPNLAGFAAKMTLIARDSIEVLAELTAKGEYPDVVYLDPMFPERTKSAAVKKKFQLLHNLEQPCDNQDELLSAALGSNPRKIIVKRPVKGPYLAGVKPSHSVLGKAVRYDCIVGKRQ